MKIVDETEEEITIKMSRADFSGIHSCVSYLISTMPKQDMTALGFFGEQGKQRLLELNASLRVLLKEVVRSMKSAANRKP